MNFIKLSKKINISVRSIQEWLKGNLLKGTRNKSNTKPDIEKLKQDILNYPDGYSNCGKRCYGVCDRGAKGRTNVIGALIRKVLFAVGLFNCNVDTTVFTTWVKQFLLSSLSTIIVIVMDNAYFIKM